MWKVIVTAWIAGEEGEVGKHLSHVSVFNYFDDAIRFINEMNNQGTNIVSVVINSVHSPLQ